MKKDLILLIAAMLVSLPRLLNNRIAPYDKIKLNDQYNHQSSAVASTKHAKLPEMQFFVRMSGSTPKHRSRYACVFFRSLMLFWPLSYSNRIILLLDDEMPTDHQYGVALANHTQEHFPEIDLAVKYEKLPSDPSFLNFTWNHISPGYNRQLWSSYFTDLYVDPDKLIVFMDNDAQFVAPATLPSLFDDQGRPRASGTTCKRGGHWKMWQDSGELALGFPLISDFMVYFPVLIYPDTIRNAREHILKHWENVTHGDFDKVFAQIHYYKDGVFLMNSPVTVLLSYAYHFERDRYSWALEFCEPISDVNARLPPGLEPVRWQDASYGHLPRPQIALHQAYSQELARKSSMANFCLASNYTMDSLPIECQGKSMDEFLQESYPLFVHDAQMYGSRVEMHPCVGATEKYCQDKLHLLYREYAQELSAPAAERTPMMRTQPMNWKIIDQIDGWAKKTVSGECPSFV